MSKTYKIVRACSAVPINGTLITHNGYSIESISNAVLVIDGISLVVGDWLLLKNQVDTTQNGLFQMTQLGIIAGPTACHWIISRVGIAASLFHNMFFKVIEGTVNSTFIFRLNTADPITSGYTPLPTSDFVLTYEPWQSSLSSGLVKPILADDGQVVLYNGTNGIDSTFTGNLTNIPFVITIIENGTTGTNATYKGDIVADDDGAIFDTGLESYIGDIIADDGSIVVKHGNVEGSGELTSGVTCYNIVPYPPKANEYGLTMSSLGNTVFRRTVLNTNIFIGISPIAGGPLALSAPIFSVNVGTSYIIKSCSVVFRFNCNPNTIAADTPDVGIGITDVTGEAQVVLSACSAGAESILTGQTMPDLNGTRLTAVSTVPSSVITATAATRTIYLSMANNWTPSVGGCTIFGITNCVCSLEWILVK